MFVEFLKKLSIFAIKLYGNSRLTHIMMNFEFKTIIFIMLT